MLPKETIDRIKANAQRWKAERSKVVATTNSHVHGYHAGAVTEAERSQKLATSLKKLNEILDELWNLAGTCHIPDRYIKAINMAQRESGQALTEYNQP